MSKTKILLVGMADSVHVGRWVAQFNASDYDFYLFPSTPNRRVHELILDSPVRILRGRVMNGTLWVLDTLFGTKIRSYVLGRDIARVKPDFIHALEFQHGAYLVEHALDGRSSSEQFIATNFGSDIFWFQQFPRHLKRIRKVLARADRYSAECKRDVDLALHYGFEGLVLPLIPNSGPISDEYLSAEVPAPNLRRKIVVKGYHGWVGRANLVANALSELQSELSEFEIVFYSCDSRTRVFLFWLRIRKGFRVTQHKKHALSHQQMMHLFSEASIYIGVSLSDGISTSMLEALAMGAYPIQTNTACTSEWFRSDKDGWEVKNINSHSIRNDILKGLTMATTRSAIDMESQRAAVRQRVNRDAISFQAHTFYTI